MAEEYVDRLISSSQDTAVSADNFVFDTIGGNRYPVSKVLFGAVGTATYVSAANPLPVVAAATDALLTTIDADTGAIATSAASIDGKITACNTGAVVIASGVQTNALTDAQLRATAVPVSGTVTAELGATDNAVLDAIAASIASIDGKVTAANTGAVTISSALPAGTNNIGDVDVLSLPALPAGSNTIGAVNLAQYTPATGRLPVDGSGVTQPVSGTFWQATQPVSAASLPLPSNAAAETGGNLAAAAASLNVMDDWDESDRAKVNTIAGQAGVQGGSGAVSASTQRVVLATDVALPTGTNSIGQVTANAGTNLNTSALALESGGNLAAVAGAVVSNGSATQAANVVQIGWHVAGDGTYAVTDTNGLPVKLLSVTGSSGSGSVGVVVSTGGSDGGTLRAFSVDSNGYADTNANIKFVAGASVDVGTGAASTGTQRIVTATNSTIGTVTTVSTLTGGGIAHDSADSGNPVKVGARAAATLSDDTMVANADRTDAVADLDGALLVRPGFPLGDLISEQVTNTNGTSTAFTNFGATASTRNYITAIVVYNSSATAGTIDFRDGTAGAVLYTVPIPATGGAVISNGGSPLFRTSANTALAYDVSGALTTVTISMTGFKSKV